MRAASLSGPRDIPFVATFALLSISELDPENETVGEGGALPLESADGAGAGHEADTPEARGGVQGQGGAGGDQGRADGRELASAYGVHPNEIYTWKNQLLDGATSVFEGGGAAAEDTASAAQVDVLYRQIGQLKVENDFLSRNPRT